MERSFIYNLSKGDMLMTDTAIKFFNANKDNDIAVYMVFHSLVSEVVYLPVNEHGCLLSLSLGPNEIIPLFTSKVHIPEEEPIELRECYIENCLDMLLKAKKHIFVNPFSEVDVQFVIPHEAIERFVIPVIQEKRAKSDLLDGEKS